jgi:uncharacterized protein involved in response to NO
LADTRTAFLNLGFRPFFAGAALFAVASMLVWMGRYVLGWQASQDGLPAGIWHAHEMIFGYSLAVIAGFLLTAVRNWTGVQTLHGIPLLLLFLIWIAGRVLVFSGEAVPLELMALVDNIFIGLLFIAVLYPVAKVRQWKQIGILSKLLLLLASNLLFYAGLLQKLPGGIHAGLYSGLYLVMALVFVMSRRVLPFFIEKGVGYPVNPRNRRWLDISSLVLFLVFWIADILHPDTPPVALLAAILFILHVIRMADWYTRGIWSKPLLWVLYLGYGLLTSGFGLKAAVVTFGISPLLAVHAFGYGGIGMISIGMMARVTLGHTGRNVFAPPVMLGWMFAVLFTGAVLRILPPLLAPSHYLLWIGGSQLLWILAFSMFVYLYLPMLVQPRADGQPG